MSRKIDIHTSFYTREDWEESGSPYDVDSEEVEIDSLTQAIRTLKGAYLKYQDSHFSPSGWYQTRVSSDSFDLYTGELEVTSGHLHGFTSYEALWIHDAVTSDDMPFIQAELQKVKDFLRSRLHGRRELIDEAWDWLDWTYDEDDDVTFHPDTIPNVAYYLETKKMLPHGSGHDTIEELVSEIQWWIDHKDRDDERLREYAQQLEERLFDDD